MAVVGRNVPRRDGVEKVTGAAKYVDDLVFPGMLHGRTVRSTIACGRIRAVHLAVRPGGLHRRRSPRHPGPQRRRAHRGRPAVPRRARGPPRRGADPAARARGPRAPARRRRSTSSTSRPSRSSTRGARPRSSSDRHQQGRRRRAASRLADEMVEGEYRLGHQEHVYIETNGVIAVPEDGGVTVHGSLQCPYYVQKALCVVLGAAAGEGARRAGRDGRRVRRQGGVPVDHRRRTPPARAEVRTAGEAGLRPRRGHGGHHQAPPGDRPPRGPA